MRNDCQDVFKEYKLPFETYFHQCVKHDFTVHDEMEIIWVLRGKAYITIDEETFVVGNENVFMVYMQQLHAISTDPNTVLIAFRVHNDYLHKKGLFFEKIPFIPRVSTFEYLADRYRQVPLLIVQILKLLLSNENKDIIRHKIYGYFNFYVEELYNMLLKERYLDIKTIDYDVYLNRVHIIVEYIYHHYHEKVTLEDLSKVVNLSVFRLSHFIKEAMNISFSQFLQQVRLEHAVDLLKNTDKDIGEIIQETGFSDHKYLNQMMKEKYQMTALKYRKENHKKSFITKFNVHNYHFIQEIKICLKRLEQDPRYQSLFELDPII